MNLAAFLLSLARRLMPPGREDWFDAMHAESRYLDGAERVRWAFGCFTTAIKQRFAPMDTGSFRVSRWVMLVETLGAFGPLTHAWWAITFDQPGLLRMSPATIEKMFLHYPGDPGGPYVLAMLIVGAVVGLFGPIGLFLGLRFVITGAGLRNRALALTLMGVPIIALVLGTIAGFVVGPADFGLGTFGHWFGIVMLAAMPVAVIWHLAILGRRAESLPPANAVAA
jgi:hypothetical protein